MDGRTALLWNTPSSPPPPSWKLWNLRRTEAESSSRFKIFKY